MTKTKITSRQPTLLIFIINIYCLGYVYDAIDSCECVQTYVIAGPPGLIIIIVALVSSASLLIILFIIR